MLGVNVSGRSIANFPQVDHAAVIALVCCRSGLEGAAPVEEAPIHGLLRSSITYRIATGPREGQELFTLQTLPASAEGPGREVAEASGFSLHAGIAAKASQRDKVERLARYVSRPPIAPSGYR